MNHEHQTAHGEYQGSQILQADVPTNAGAEVNDFGEPTLREDGTSLQEAMEARAKNPLAAVQLLYGKFSITD